ncbi:two-component system, OmpR family, response regulator CpxR [Oceanospirillum multiglobuliferum]|uniref:DNA-binding response regulator n=1 Tax=Oceanospirillum multiglobuliferum TaxID=64969 RepID=A0A1T4Q8K4_9GAMM|nr:response regulator transcription factor [Oceanospirillum multiglobuliferum]OPX56576.1 DNA-binding response regulator [Oceanospirillum multiglobuliferum]SKA00044.1 two-component system, OmpR family, response regulator CpxR [Oceanospirillum multiglobuliferum]
MSSENILLVDDDIELCALLKDYLQAEGYQIEVAHNAHQALERLQGNGNLSLMILDIMMPGISGLELLQQIRPRYPLPIIMLTGRGDEVDRIIGLEMGADDYLSKPCNPRELLARIRAIFRRANPQTSLEGTLQDQVLRYNGIELNPATREVRVQGQLIELTSAEFNALGYLMQHSGRVLSKEQLTRWVLHREFTLYDRAIDVHISRVRQKLGQALENPAEIIKTVRGQGYIFVQQPMSDSNS